MAKSMVGELWLVGPSCPLWSMEDHAYHQNKTMEIYRRSRAGETIYCMIVDAPLPGYPKGKYIPVIIDDAIYVIRRQDLKQRFCL